jgi:hypothetical protein
MCRACGQRDFYGPLPVGSLQASKSDRLLSREERTVDVDFGKTAHDYGRYRAGFPDAL